MNPTEVYAQLFESFLSSQDENHYTLGKLPLDEPCLNLLKQASIYKLCSNSVRLFDGTQEISKKTVSQLDQAHFGLTVEIKLHDEVIGEDFYIGRNWNTLLFNAKYISSAPSSYYFTNFTKRENSEKRLRSLTEVNKIYSLLRSVAHRKIGNEIIINLREMLSLEFDLDEFSLDKNISFSAIEIFRDKTIHKESKELLLKENLIRFLRDIPERNRFNHLLLNFEVFASYLLLSYEKFISDYSFDKLRREYLEKRSEYIEKINNAFDNVSLKLLSLPATVWISFTQLDGAADDTSQLIKNSGILIATLFVTIFMLASLFGQFPLLSSIKSEYQSLFKRLDESTDTENTEIHKCSHDLDTRRRITIAKLIFSLLATFCTAIFTVTLFFYTV